jgi:hypothetical protein
MSRRQRLDKAGTFTELFAQPGGAAPISLFDIIGHGGGGGENSNDGVTPPPPTEEDARAPTTVITSLADLEAEYERETERVINAHAARARPRGKKKNSPKPPGAPSRPAQHLGKGADTDVPFQSPGTPDMVPQVAAKLTAALAAVPEDAREFLRFLLRDRPRAFLSEARSRTDTRRSVEMFEHHSRCYVNTRSTRWDDVLTRWAGARVLTTTPDDPTSPRIDEQFTVPGAATPYSLRVYQLESAFYVFCVFEGDTYLGAFYAQSEASHQLDIAVATGASPASTATVPKTTAGSM